MSGEISQELALRMAALLRDQVERNRHGNEDTVIGLKEARAIVALLPVPVDPDLILARHVAGNVMAGWTNGCQTYATGSINAVRTGNDDGSIHVVVALAAIKRGRELAAQS